MGLWRRDCSFPGSKVRGRDRVGVVPTQKGGRDHSRDVTVSKLPFGEELEVADMRDVLSRMGLKW